MYDLIIDTETTDIAKRMSAQPNPSSMLIYDFGGVVRNTKTGEIVDSFSFIISETFYNINLMNTAYYAKKLPQYHKGVQHGEWTSVSFAYAYHYVHGLIEKYNIKTVWAYNASFDVDTLNATIRIYSNGFISQFFNDNIKFKDIWNRVTNITGTKKYVSWCIDNGYLSAKGNPKTSAEIVYRYLVDNHDFIEDHTAESDARIEAFILTCAQKNKKKSRVRDGLRANGWREASKIAKSL
jgi:hypothetical protein